MPQSIRWKQAADQEGFRAVGSWAAKALDAYLEHRTRAGRPIPLAWHKGTVCAVLDGQEVTLKGWISPPFGAYRGTAAGPLRMGCRRYTLVHLPTGRIVATLRSIRQCYTLAAELAPIFARDEQGADTIQ